MGNISNKNKKYLDKQIFMKNFYENEIKDNKREIRNLIEKQRELKSLSYEYMGRFFKKKELIALNNEIDKLFYKEQHTRALLRLTNNNLNIIKCKIKNITCNNEELENN